MLERRKGEGREGKSTGEKGKEVEVKVKESVERNGGKREKKKKCSWEGD